jgi:hypothetical protein
VVFTTNAVRERGTARRAPDRSVLSIATATSIAVGTLDDDRGAAIGAAGEDRGVDAHTDAAISCRGAGASAESGRGVSSASIGA